MVASVSLTFFLCLLYTCNKDYVLCLEDKKEDVVYFSTAQFLHKFCVNYNVVNVVIGMITYWEKNVVVIQDVGHNDMQKFLELAKSSNRWIGIQIS